jgi:ribose/xylose/arabinose/galactoside ABC-type transport system permease subunit
VNRPSGRAGRGPRRFLAVWALPIALLLVAAVFAVAEPAFLSVGNLTGIVHRVATTGIMAVGMTFVIMTGGIDLSVGPVLGLSGVVAYLALTAGGLSTGMAVAAGLGAGILVGALNGLAVAVLRLPSIIVTLGMLSMVRGGALILGGPELHQISGQPGYTFIGAGFLLRVPFSIWLFAAVGLAMIFVQTRTTFGLQISIIGDNERAAFLSGRRVRLIKATAYVLSSLTAAAAGIIESSQVYTASATFGEFGTELDVIAAVVLGGTSLMGGRGSVARTLVGVLFLGVINDGLNIVNVPLDVQLIMKGAIIAVALSFSEWVAARQQA